jgi:selenocysteine-specific elongation factor
VELDGPALVAARSTWNQLAADLRAALSAFHAAHPLRAGMPREELKSRLNLSPKIFNAVLAQAERLGLAAASAALARLPGHTVTFSAAQQAAVEAVLADFRRDPHNTPSVKDCAARLGADVLAVLVEQATLVQVSPEVLFLSETYAAMLERVREHARSTGKITVAEARDLFGTSRKYALALLEYLDAQGVTKRVGDERVLRPPPHS